MTSIGDTLRRERQRRNLDLPTVAAELKIAVRFLEAMEQDDFGKLPGGVFTRSFARQYAGFLGLDADEIAAELKQVVEPPPAVPDLPDKDKPDVPGIQLAMGEDSWQSVRERPMPLPSWLKSGVLLVVLMLVCSGVYWWFERPRHAVIAQATTPPPKTAPIAQAPVSEPAEVPPATASPAQAPASAPPTEASAEPAAKTTPADSTAPAAPAPSEVPNPAPNPNASVRVAITADEPVWVRADVNGKYQFSGTLQPHETRNIDGDGQVTLRLGNAGGATITLNGKPVGAVGPKGQIRTVQFTSGGFQIVSVPKSPDPEDRF